MDSFGSRRRRNSKERRTRFATSSGVGGSVDPVRQEKYSSLSDTMWVVRDLPPPSTETVHSQPESFLTAWTSMWCATRAMQYAPHWPAVALPMLIRLANRRYAPGTPAGSCRNHTYPV